MPITIEVATKQETWARVELAGPSGSGKTYTALRIARGIVGPNGKIGVICTENRTARKYSGDFRFWVADMKPPFSPAAYIEAIREFAKLGVDCLIVDSFSHAWAGPGGLLERVDMFTQASKSKNSFSEGWSKATPEQNGLMQELGAFPGHLIITLRVKTHYEIVDNGRGGKEPKRIGMAPIQRDGVEYEFDVCMDLDQMIGNVWKTRCSALVGAIIQKPGEDLGKTIRDWLTDGTIAVPPPGVKISVESGLVGFGPYRGLPRVKLTDAELQESIKLATAKIDGAPKEATWLPDARAHLAALELEQQQRQGVAPAQPVMAASSTASQAETSANPGTHGAKRKSPPQRRPRKTAAQSAASETSATPTAPESGAT
jgi:DNA polymerase III delta prime subunit